MTIKQAYPTQRPALDLNFARQKRLDPRVTFTRGSTATYVGSDGLIKTAADDEARFDYDPETGESLGLLLEGTRTNESPYSETFQDNGDDTGWRTSGGTVTPSAGTSPSGGAASSIDGSIYKRLNWGAAGTKNATSVYVKAGTGTTGTLSHQNSNAGGISFDLAAGTVTPIYTCDGTFIEPVGNGWFRIGFNRTSTSTLTAVNLYLTTTPGETVLFWGVQVEKAGTFTTSYIPTSGSTVTRSADLASILGSAYTSIFGASIGAGSIFADVVVLGEKNNTNTGSFAGFGTSNNDKFTSFLTYDNRLNVGFVKPALGNITKYHDLTGQRVKGATGWTNLEELPGDQTNASSALDGDLYGGSQYGGAGSPLNTEYDRFGIGRAIRSVTGSNLTNGHIARLTYYPTRLPDTQLQALTL